MIPEAAIAKVAAKIQARDGVSADTALKRAKAWAKKKAAPPCSFPGACTCAAPRCVEMAKPPRERDRRVCIHPHLCACHGCIERRASYGRGRTSYWGGR